jgi:hypothetical protein
MLSPSDRFAMFAFEAALDRNRWLWAELARLEQESRRNLVSPPVFHEGSGDRDLARPLCSELLRSYPLA